jgi:hypothetical protein
MTEQQLPRLRLYLTAVVMLVELAFLLWEHFNGGVRSHHLLNRSDMPAISNWWGVLLLPALTWLLTGRIQRRIALHADRKEAAVKLPGSVVTGFVGSLLFGILLSVAFTNNYETTSAFLFGGLLVLAVLLPAYRAECVLGFVLGMTFTFGAVLPTVIGSVLAALSAVIHLYVRPVLMHFWTWLKRTPSATA